MTPLALTFSLIVFGHIQPPPYLNEVSVILMYTQAVLDPILLGLALKDIRDAFHRLLTRTRS